MSKEFKVGLFAIISGAILYLGFNYLKGKEFLSPTQTYFAVYKNIDGLNVSNPVIVNGFAVGRVSAISILQEQNHQIMVEMDVDEKVVLGTKTKATLTNSDFLGSKAILLTIGNLAQPLENGDTLISDIDKGLATLFESAQPITANLDMTIRRINAILLGMEGSGEEIKNSIISFNITLKSVNQFVKQNNEKVKQTFDGVNALVSNINTKVDQLNPILSSATQTLTKINNLPIDSTFYQLNQSLASLSSLMVDINAGKGTMGQLMVNDSLYQNLNQTLLDLDQLLIHFDENPKHFLSPLGQSKKKIDKDRK